MWEKYLALTPENSFGIEVIDEKKLLIRNDHAYINNLPFQAEEADSIYVGFSFLTDDIGDKKEFLYHVDQYESEGELQGSVTFFLKRSERDDFQADAGLSQMIEQGESLSLHASDINEGAIYNWYDINDSLFYSGKSPSLTPEFTQHYKLEVIATTDGFKDYDSVQVIVNPYSIKSITPNPVVSNALIAYDAEEASSAYLMIYPVSSNNSFNNYIINTQDSATTINLSAYANGLYLVVLVCDGQIVDSELFIKQ